MKPTNFPKRKAYRIEDGKKRDEATAKLSPKQRLDRLDLRLGKGEGAVKERARLQKMLMAEKREKDSEGTPEVVPVERPRKEKAEKKSRQ